MERQGRLRRRWIVKPGSGNQGVMLFWDDTLQAYVPTETTELFWDDTNKRLGVRTNSPAAELEVSGTLVITRLLAGGVLP